MTPGEPGVMLPVERARRRTQRSFIIQVAGTC